MTWRMSSAAVGFAALLLLPNWAIAAEWWFVESNVNSTAFVDRASVRPVDAYGRKAQAAWVAIVAQGTKATENSNGRSLTYIDCATDASIAERYVTYVAGRSSVESFSARNRRHAVWDEESMGGPEASVRLFICGASRFKDRSKRYEVEGRQFWYAGDLNAITAKLARAWR